jgi:hypothetical protein
MRSRLCQARTLEEILADVVIEPELSGLETRNYRMARGVEMRGCVLLRRIVAAADVSALGASAQM